MICSNCNKKAISIKVGKHGERCNNCGGFSATSGKSTENILSRTSDRVREQQVNHEADMIQPFVYDDVLERQVLNKDFIEHYPERARDFYTEDELQDAGYADLPEPSDDENDIDMSEIEYNDETEHAINSLVEEQHKERHNENEHTNLEIGRATASTVQPSPSD